MDLKAPLRPDTTVPLTLTFRTASGEQRQLALQVPVSVAAPRDAGAATTHGVTSTERRGVGSLRGALRAPQAC